MRRSRFGIRPAHCRASLLSWPLLAAVSLAQVERPPKPAPPEPIQPAVLRAGTVLKLAGYLTPEKPPPPPKEKGKETGRERPPPPFRIGLLGQDAVTAAAMATLPGKPVGDAKAVVVEVATLTAIEGHAADACDLLYVAESIDDKVLERVVAMHADKPMPIVCERPGFAAAGGTIQLFVEDKDLRFEVNTDMLRTQGMKASPQLLKLSRKGPTR